MSKREEVLKELGDIAKVLNIKIDYIKDDKREYLVCDDTKICTLGTNICGIRQEFFGYVFLLEWRHRSVSHFEKQTRNFIRQYWYDDNFNQPITDGFIEWCVYLKLKNRKDKVI